VGRKRGSKLRADEQEADKGGADQGERAGDREALRTKGRWRKSGCRAVKECVLAWGDLALCLKGQRR
jgi:hypothetical protein